MQTFFAPAKLNLFLHVIGRREDGYHRLQSALTLIDRGDTITLSVNTSGDITRCNEVTGVTAEADLSVRAARLLQSVSGTVHGCEIVVNKRTPMGAGLGGGSADAATVLLALNQLWSLNWTTQQLQKLGAKLGADVPFFVFGESAFVEGIGEVLTAIDLPLWWYVVVTPPVHVPTPFVFQQPELTRNTQPVKIADFSGNDFASVHNDLQSVVLKAFPVVGAHFAALQRCADRSLFGARMTGSGAGVFAAFVDEESAREALHRVQRNQPEITGFIAKGLHRHPLV